MQFRQQRSTSWYMNPQRFEPLTRAHVQRQILLWDRQNYPRSILSVNGQMLSWTPFNLGQVPRIHGLVIGARYIADVPRASRIVTQLRAQQTAASCSHSKDMLLFIRPSPPRRPAGKWRVASIVATTGTTLRIWKCVTKLATPLEICHQWSRPRGIQTQMKHVEMSNNTNKGK